MKICLFALFFSPLILSAQYLSDLEIPKEKGTYYESLQANNR